MRTFVIIPLILAPLGGCSGNAIENGRPEAAKAFGVFKSPDASFSILMPGEPFAETKKFNVGDAEVVQQKHSVFRDNKRELFMVFYMDFPNPLSDDLLDDFASAVAADAKGKVIEKRNVTSNGDRGVEVKVEVPNTGIISTRIFLKGSRCYQASIALPASKASSPEVQEFLGSFKLLK